VEATRREFRTFREYGSQPPIPVQFTVLSYKLPSGSRLLLDGSHRVTALGPLAQAGWPFKVTEFSITGPIDGRICFDLYHFSGGVPDDLLKDPAWPEDQPAS
jgi:hypothetical protein